MKKGLFITTAMMLLLVFLTKYAVSGDQKAEGVSQEQIMQNMHRIQIPFIANNGQVDERVTFYANTFGGTVFVTNEGEIVYALPKSADDDNRSQKTGVRIQKCRGELHSPDVIHDTGCETQDNHESCIKPCRLGEAECTQQINDLPPPTPKSQSLKPETSLQGVALKETLVGASAGKITGEQPAVTKINYFKGSDPSKWKSNITTYDVVNLGEVYKGIELKLKAYGNNVEKLFYVKPGADPNQIKINLSGIKDCGVQNAGCGIENPKFNIQNPKLSVNEQGQLVAETELGPVTFTKPVAYQEIDGKRVNVDVEYIIENTVVRRQDTEDRSQDIMNHEFVNPKSPIFSPQLLTPNPPSPVFKAPTQNFEAEVSNPKSKIVNRKLEYGFKVASYDKTKELVIDPLLASTFLGGDSKDYCYAIDTDSSGNVYIAGHTYSDDFPTKSGSYDTAYNSRYDVFVSKFDGSLSNLLASTYLGGSSSEECYSIAISSSNYVYITGNTYSSDFPTTSGAYDTSKNGNYDVFVTKLSSSLGMSASTYLGGSSKDYGYSIAVDSSSNVYVTGDTYSSNFPTTSGSYDSSQNGNYDVFVSKLTSSLSSLSASTYLGGSSKDYSRSLVVDSSGNAYITGYTYSSNFPTTSGAYDTSKNSNYDVFVSKFNSSLNLSASTYLGGSSGDYGFAISLDSSNNVLIAGHTYSSSFPTTSGAYDTSKNSNYDVFVSKLSSSLSSLSASTFLGGSSKDYGYALETDSSNNVYVTGYTYSSDFPTISDAYDSSSNGSYDVFVAKLNSSLSSLSASSYLGGSKDDYAFSIAINSSDDIYTAGHTYSSSNFPVTSGAYDTSHNGNYDVFVAKLDSDISSSDSSSDTSANLDVPYLDQMDIPEIGDAACASASAAMILAYHRKIENTQDAMIDAAETVFDATSTYESGLLSRDYLEEHLEDYWGFSSVEFDDSQWDDLYEIIKDEIRDKRPLILGSRSMTSAGHYIVVTGYEGNDYQDGKVIVNDPYGHWYGYNNYSTSESGKGLKYDFTDITSSSSDGVFVIIP